MSVVSVADYRAELCDCCLVWLANNDDSGCAGTCGPDDHPEGLMGQWNDVNGQVVPGDESDRHAFSTVQCDGCGTHLAGTRTSCPVVVLETKSDFLARRAFGWFDFEPEPEVTGDGAGDPDKYILTIVAWPGEDNEEIAVVVHRTCNGKYPLDGPLANEKRQQAQRIVDLLNEHGLGEV